MSNEVVCPWCEEKTVPDVEIVKRDNANVKERRCTKCKKILAAYLDKEKGFLPNIRKFEH